MMRRTLLLGLPFVAACAGDPVRPPPPPPAVASVTVTPESAAVIIYDTLRLQGVVRDSQGEVLDRAVTWSSSDPSKVFVQPTGRVQALGRGRATITATAEGKSGHATIATVAPITVIQVTPNSANLDVGDTVRLRATVYSSDGGPPTDSTVTWTSGDTTRVTVTSSGLATARSPGAAAVTATSGSAIGTATIIVSLATIARSATGDTLTQWQELCPTGCRFTYPVTLQSLDTSVAQFVGCCTVQGRAAGTDTILATADGVSGRAIVRVSPLAFTDIGFGNYQACGLNAERAAYCWGASHPQRAARGEWFIDFAMGNSRRAA